MLFTNLTYKEQYLLEIDHQTLEMIGDTRLRAACKRSGCVFSVKNATLTRHLISGFSMRYCIVEMRSSCARHVRRCNRQLEMYFPFYIRRRPYNDLLTSVRLRFDEWTPDNTALVTGSQRFGRWTPEVSDLGPLHPTSDFNAAPPHAPDVSEPDILDWLHERQLHPGEAHTTPFGNCQPFLQLLFRSANIGRRSKGSVVPEATSLPLPRMNYFQDPHYMDCLVDPELRRREIELQRQQEAERHSSKTAKTG